MDIDKIITHIEDKDIEINNDWYFHATAENIEIIKQILDDGIKSAYLLGEKNKSIRKENPANGKYYISLYKYTEATDRINSWLDAYPKFVIEGIEPLYANRKKYNFRRMFINTKVPLRTSEWDGEYHQYLMIEPSKIVALGYDLSYMMKELCYPDEMIREIFQKEKLELLKSIILYMNGINCHLPIYDFHTKREINKGKVLTLHIWQKKQINN